MSIPLERAMWELNDVPFDLEDLLEAIDDVEITLGVELADIAGVEPTFVVIRLGGGFGVVEVRDGSVVGAIWDGMGQRSRRR